MLGKNKNDSLRWVWAMVGVVSLGASAQQLTTTLGAATKYLDSGSYLSEPQSSATQTSPETPVALARALPSASAFAQVPAEIGSPFVYASSALVLDQRQGTVLYAKNADSPRPIASITKLMTAMVVLDSDQPLAETITISPADVAATRRMRSRLAVGMRFTRAELLHLMLMASENRAAAALARSYPDGTAGFVARMNRTAMQLGLGSTRFADSSGLSSENVSTARDLALLVQIAYQYPTVREYSTTSRYSLPLPRSRRVAMFRNTNKLTANAGWNIGLSKTGYISAAGQCLVLQTSISGKPYVMVILDSSGRRGRIGDAIRMRDWVERYERSSVAQL